MPVTRARSISSATARMAFPVLVYCRIRWRRAIAATAMAMTTRLLYGTRILPKVRVSATGMSKFWGLAPQIMMMVLRTTKARPMEIIINVVGVVRFLRMVDQSTFSVKSAKAMTPRVEMTIEIQMFIPKPLRSSVRYAPKVMKSPWAKLERRRMP